MKFGEIVAPTIKELFIQRIEGMILSGALRPGDSLPTERELADEMKISKTVIHEGIRELARLGFLDVVSRKGVTVADYAQNGNLDTLMAIMRYKEGRLDEKTMGSLLEVRGFLECPALEKLAECHTEADLELLEKLLQEARDVPGDDIPALANALFRFHRAIIFLSGNTITPLIFNAFMSSSLTFWEDYIRIIGAEASLEQLEDFLYCIRHRKGTEAAEMLREGLEQFPCSSLLPLVPSVE